MTDYTTHCRFAGRLVFLGFGSIGQGTLPLILRHIDMPKDRISIITADDRGLATAQDLGVIHRIEPLTRENYQRILGDLLQPGDFLVNVSVDVSSIALIEVCQARDVLYIDTCIEPWPGGYTDTSLSPSLRSNYALRENALKLRDNGKPTTALLTHGANPGMVSHFVKQALVNIAKDLGETVTIPQTREAWAGLAHHLGVKVIHIAERDTQVAAEPKPRGVFVNTWSIDGFCSEGMQPAELGWGSHEKALPADGRRHEFGRGSSIYLLRNGASTRVRTWTPMEGPFHGFLITHGESITISDYLTVRQGDTVVYRPTVHYAYHPCDDAVLSVHEFAGKNWIQQEEQQLIVDEVISGVDELGVLLAGHKKGAYWFGSQLSIEETRELVPYNNATSLQVCVAVLAGIVWAIENPTAGVVEPEDMDFERAMEIMLPYLGPVVGAYTDWTPLTDRERLFAEDLDHDDPWQFRNIRVV